MSLLCGGLAAVLLIVGTQQTAFADRDLVTRVEAIAWSGVNPDAYCVRIRDAQKGDKLQVRQIGNPMPLVSVVVTPETERQVFQSAQFAPWSFVVGVHAGMTAPNGWKVFGQFERSVALLRIGVTNGRASMEIGKVQVRADPVSGGYAKAAVRTAYWSPDSMRVIVIVNHRITSSAWGLDQDEAQAFKVSK